jgi:LmbE family N-acetylglucosaminyl deacetylase
MTIKFPPLTPKVVLGIGAHPDDLEFCIGGSVAKWIAEGATVYYYILTNGNKGTSDRALTPDQLQDTRRDEQRAAAQLLGVKEVFFSDYEDGGLQVSTDVKRDIVRIIRTVKPDVVLTFDPTVIYDSVHGVINHTDHRAVGQATLDAVYPLARDHLSFPELLEDGLEPHCVSTVLLANFTDYNYCCDISGTMDIKLKALGAHASQFADMEHMEQLLRKWNQEWGAESNCQYAEAFIRIDVE